MPDKLMTTQETAERTRISVNTLAYWRQIGQGPAWAKLGKRVFYRESEVQAWLDAQFAVPSK